MKKLTYKGIINLQIFLIILLITFGFVVSKNIVNVTNKQFFAPGSAAATSATECDKFKIEDLYNINAELSDNARKLEISVKPDYPDKKVREELKKATFRLLSINYQTVHDDIRITPSNTKTINLNDIAKYKSANDSDVVLKFKADNVIVKDCDLTLKFEIFAENIFGGKIVGEEVKGGDRVQTNSYSLDISDTINCNNPKTNAEKDYCDMLRRISSNGVTIKQINSNQINDEGVYTGSRREFSCNIKSTSNKSTENENEYFTNISAFTATKELEEPLTYAYKYRFAPGNYFEDTAPIKCKIKCTETVMVEYGPPVATKAGLCFEYQIKATSHVSCKATKLPEPPVQYAGYCDPRPRCVHKDGRVLDRAGPNDDFEKCIEKCDGGKYSEKCSKKCYDKVYTKNSTGKKMLTYIEPSARKVGEVETLQQQIDTCKNITATTSVKNGKYTLNEYKGEKKEYYGCYYWSGNEILWQGNYQSPARFYPDEDPNRNYSIYTVSDGYGFIRKVRDNGTVCGADCYYATDTCDQYRSGDRTQRLKSEYLNPGVAHEDNVANTAIYDKAVAECKSKATCKTTTAYFTINVGNQTNNTEDTLSYNKANKTNNGNQDYTSKLNNSKFIKSFDGCYKNGDTNHIWYKTKWGLGSSWIHTKTGELSYTKQGDDFIKKENKYCLPLSTNNTNSKWWNYYYTQLYGKSNSPTSSINSGAFVNECTNSGSCNWKVNNVSNSDINWNIVGLANDFGYFHWDIGTKCFYATNNNICSYQGSNSNNANKKCSSQTKKIRTVDLKKLFPATNETGASSERAPGYNWTAYSSNGNKTTSQQNKNKQTNKTNYNINPQAYKQWVQERNYSIYSYDNEYLDYYVELTRNKIRTVKKDIDAGNVNFGSFKSITDPVKSDVINYKSSFLRDTIGATVPKDSALKCNNMHNYKTEGCETFN